MAASKKLFQTTALNTLKTFSVVYLGNTAYFLGNKVEVNPA